MRRSSRDHVRHGLDCIANQHPLTTLKRKLPHNAVQEDRLSYLDPHLWSVLDCQDDCYSLVTLFTIRRGALKNIGVPPEDAAISSCTAFPPFTTDRNFCSNGMTGLRLLRTNQVNTSVSSPKSLAEVTVTLSD